MINDGKFKYTLIDGSRPADLWKKTSWGMMSRRLMDRTSVSIRGATGQKLRETTLDGIQAVMG